MKFKPRYIVGDGILKTLFVSVIDKTINPKQVIVIPWIVRLYVEMHVHCKLSEGLGDPDLVEFRHIYRSNLLISEH